MEFDEEFKMAELAELANLENWSFMHPLVLNSGRVTYPPELTEEERDALKETDPQPELLSSISTAKRKPLNESGRGGHGKRVDSKIVRGLPGLQPGGRRRGRADLLRLLGH